MLQDLVVLGANSALPLYDRFSSSFVLRTSGSYFLIDAGEGCQMKLGQFKVKRSKISHVFISHLHGDHVYGLPGLITSFNLNNRKDDLTIFGPSGIREFVEVVLKLSQVHLNFKIEIREIDIDVPHHLVTIQDIEITAFPLKHRIPTYGYLFRENQVSINIITDKIAEHNLTVDEILNVKKGFDIQRKFETIPNSELTYIKRSPKSFAYCSDTVYDPSLSEICQGVNLMYHEATYLDYMKDQAASRMHSTTKEAALVAKYSKVNKLLIGHYSSRYNDLEVLVEEAREVFRNTEIATEGKIIEII